MNANSSCVDNQPPSSERSRQGLPASETNQLPAPASNGAGPSVPGDRPSAAKPAPLSMRSSMREAPTSSRDFPPPSSRSEAALRASKEALHNLAPGLTSKLNLAADCLLVVAAAAFSSAGRGTLQ